MSVNVTRAVIVARFSTEADAGEFSMERQVDACRAYADAHGWVVVREFRTTISGLSRDRADLDEVVRGAREGQWSKVLVLRWDRLARSMRMMLNTVDELEQAGCGVVSVQDGGDMSGPTAVLLRNVMSSFAEHEAALIVARGVAGQRHKAARGEWPGGAAPYGYSLVDGRIVPDEAEREVIRVGADLLIDGQTTGQVADALNALGFTTRGGSAWSYYAVRRVWSNEALMGVAYWGKPTRKSGHHTKLDAHGKPVNGEPVRIDLPDPPLTPDRFRLAQQSLERRAHGAKRESNDFPLTGSLRCVCGQPMHGVTHRDRRSYRCKNHRHKARKEGTWCPQPLLDAQTLESRVFVSIGQQLNSPSLVIRAVREATAARAGTASRTQAATDLAEATAALNRANDGLAAGLTAALRAGAGPEVIEAVTRQANADIAALQQRISALREVAEAPDLDSDEGMRHLQRVVALVNRLIDPDAAPAPQAYRRLLAALGAQIELITEGREPDLLVQIRPDAGGLALLVDDPNPDPTDSQAGDLSAPRGRLPRLGWLLD